MIKSTAVALLVVAALAVGSALGGAASRRSAHPGPGRLQHTIRAFGYELAVGAHLWRVADASAQGTTAASCPALVDTVFVLVLPTGLEAGGVR